MTAKLYEFPGVPHPAVTIEDALGGCPDCGKLEQYLNVGREHWGFCDTHKTKWCIGSNLFSCWRNETEEDWAKNRAQLAPYKTIE